MWDSLTRPRDHPLIDFLLGLSALSGVVGAISGISPVVAGALFLVGAIGLMVMFRNEERARREVRSVPGRSSAGPVDDLEALVAKALPVPLTDQVRLNPKRLSKALERVAVEAPPSSRTTAALEDLRQLLRDAREVPLTGQVRIDRGEAHRLLDELREGRTGGRL